MNLREKGAYSETYYFLNYNIEQPKNVQYNTTWF